MQKNLKYESAGSAAAETFTPRMVKMDYDGVLVTEKMEEIMSLCERNRPIYEQVTSFSVALYTLEFFNAPDFMSFQDVSAGDAAEILDAEFSEIKFDNIPKDYHIARSKERYLMVVGDPRFPVHFAVVADMGAARPYFSKLPFFGAGYDSLDELKSEFAGTDGVTAADFHFYRKNWYGQIPPASVGKIYIVKE